jgi:hypothetical protein
MFKENPNITKLAEEIFLYKNFISKEEAAELHKACLNYPEEVWNTTVNPIEWYNGKTSIFVDEAKPYLERLRDLVKDTHTPTPSLSFTRMFPGDSLHVHQDSCGDDEPTANDHFGTCAITEYGVVIYLNECFNGGDIFYPDLNINYQPSAGDLVIHHAMIKHGVNEVIEGVRYSYPMFLVKNSLKESILEKTPV